MNKYAKKNVFKLKIYNRHTSSYLAYMSNLSCNYIKYRNQIKLECNLFIFFNMVKLLGGKALTDTRFMWTGTMVPATV